MRRTILGKSRSRITIYGCLILIYSRCSSVCAYYTPFSDRPNLTVLTEVLVNRILWEQPAQIPGSADGIVNTSTSLPRMKATGVEFTHTGPDGQRNRISVRKEVVLAAGAIGSPKVLELSGVGNSTYVLFLSFVLPVTSDLTDDLCSILKAAGVEPVLDLPSVGENLAGKFHPNDIRIDS